MEGRQQAPGKRKLVKADTAEFRNLADGLRFRLRRIRREIRRRANTDPLWKI